MSTPPSAHRTIGATSVGQTSSRGSRLSAASGSTTGSLMSLNALT
jgi:hypothetical protein